MSADNEHDDKTQSYVVLAAGIRVSHYRIIEKIGSGGMGEVYSAEDTELDRKVALKFLPPHLCPDEECRARFKREARAAAKLNHPNIVTIHEVSEYQGRPLFAMEHIDGQTLRDVLKESELSIDKVIDLATQICEALREAHRANIVHRDIKPSNILIDRNDRPKLVDFGLAAVQDVDPLTKSGSTLGTVGYMSPEQVRGEKTDARSDLFSLGVVLYEALTGRAPFKGDTETATMNAVLNTIPEPLARYKSNLPDELQRIVLKLLEKDQQLRYQSSAGVISDLRKLNKDLESGIVSGQPATKPSRPSIATLPFRDMSPQKDQEYFCEGLAEELINALTRIEGLQVASRTSSFQFKEEKLDVREIGRKLNVKTVLEGSVRKAGNRLRITAQLVNVADGYHLWSERFDRDMEDIFAIQDEISLAIIDKLKIKLLGKEKKMLVKRHTENQEAYNLYLKGRYFWNRRHEIGFKKSIDYFQQAIEKDPLYAPAYVGIADTFNTLGYFGYLPPEEAFPKAKAAAEKALEIDAAFGDAYASLGLTSTLYDWDWSAAESAFQKALKLNPNYASAHEYYAGFLTAMGRFNEAIAEVRRAQELDPLSLIINVYVGFFLYFARRYDESIAQCLKTLEMDPGFPLALVYLSLAYVEKTMHQEVIEILPRAELAAGETVYTLGIIGYCYGVVGQNKKALELLDRLNELSKKRHVSSFLQSMIYIGLDRSDEAFELLEMAYKKHDPVLVFLKSSPISDRLRSDPRFEALLKKIGLH